MTPLYKIHFKWSQQSCFHFPQSCLYFNFSILWIKKYTSCLKVSMAFLVALYLMNTNRGESWWHCCFIWVKVLNIEITDNLIAFNCIPKNIMHNLLWHAFQDWTVMQPSAGDDSPVSFSEWEELIGNVLTLCIFHVIILMLQSDGQPSKT